MASKTTTSGTQSLTLDHYCPRRMVPYLLPVSVRREAHVDGCVAPRHGTVLALGVDAHGRSSHAESLPRGKKKRKRGPANTGNTDESFRLSAHDPTSHWESMRVGGGRGDGGSHAEQLMLGKERKRRQRGSTEFGLADVLQRSCAHLQGHTHPTPSVIQPSSGRSCCIGRNRFWNASQEM